MKKPEPTIAELCKPLSAKVMPRSAMLDTYGNERTEGKAMGIQRNTARTAPPIPKGKKK